MATCDPTPLKAAEHLDLETHINKTIDGLIEQLNLRRAHLLAQLHYAREEMRAAQVARQELATQQFLKNILVETQLRWQCDTRDLELTIFHLGEIVQVPVSLPNYSTFNLPTVITGQRGYAPGELHGPSGVTINQATNQIFVANWKNNRVEIFSETGEYLDQLGDQQLYTPWGVVIHGNNVFVSSHWGEHTVSKYSIADFSLVKRIGKEGSNNGEFNWPRQLTTDTYGDVFIADSLNNRICVFDIDLNHLWNITNRSIYFPYDVKISNDRVYVLCPRKNPCMLVLSLGGDMIQSLISRGQGMDVLRPLFFCLDTYNNIVVSDEGTHSIRVFSQAGNLLYTIGREGHQQGMFYRPHGIAIVPNGKLVCASRNNKFGLQIFS